MKRSRLARIVGPIRVFLVTAVVATLVGLPGPSASAASAVENETASSDLLSFTAGGHVLGFEARGVYVASGSHVLRVEFVGPSLGGSAPVGDQRSSDGPSASPLGKVTYPNLWPGISLTYEPYEFGIAKSAYFVDPGAKVEDIRLRYNVPVELAEDGSVVFAFDTGEMRESAPVAWQEIEGERVGVEVDFRLLEEREMGFVFGSYDARYPLVVDPELAWNTFLGGSGNDYNYYAIAVDGDGNVYVTGYSSATWGSPVRSYTSSDDAFVAKMDANGGLVWNTFLGGSGGDQAFSVALDDSKNVHVTGRSNATWGSPVRAYAGAGEAFAAKLDSSGNLLWNTFLGSAGTEAGYSIAVDGNGNVYVTGEDTATWGSPVRAYTSDFDAFVVKLNSSGSLVWNSFLGGTGEDVGVDIAVDESGNVYVVGQSTATWASPLRSYTSGYDGFVAKLDGSGNLQWNTFLGGSGTDQGLGIAVDDGGNVYVAGYGSATWGSPVRSYTSGNDGFAAKLNSSGSLHWNTFLEAQPKSPF